MNKKTEENNLNVLLDKLGYEANHHGIPQTFEELLDFYIAVKFTKRGKNDE